RGYYIGIGGILTYPGADRLRQAVAAYPRERVLLETDAPFLSPQGRRGRRNEPAHLVEVAGTLGRLWNQPAEAAAAVTSANARELFGLPRPDTDGGRA